ncbi:hypothetical protein TVAG_210920 [Trichomonas vaginalis G3]|uniref:P/Homo B domain-containing protein n=1 Tax=Trichomonas vaginalis (strain ATCC PRA-98 / G3) TaxID=412133 RepID=A2F878_TRIV3|nr:serine-type endopeptidase protein [Trichomonas vaginalis G3]EAX98898.1 hypothetical protein TVAG_210920 [Trichomonas vaginalis G3]KAI5511637.1 serine-type endopeptidase protein [Trichomonas vaginalis G3]|eukprot:XP_001311828.1 hypothetical protein [Trichomonas vaginalis G3]
MTLLFLISTWWIQNDGKDQLGIEGEDINWKLNSSYTGKGVRIVAMGDGARLDHKVYADRANKKLFVNIIETVNYKEPPNSSIQYQRENISQSSLALAAGSGIFPGIAPDATVGAFYFFDNQTQAEDLQYTICYNSDQWDIAILSYQYDLCHGGRKFCAYPEPDSLKEEMVGKCLFNTNGKTRPKLIVVPVEHNQASDVLFTPPARWPLVFTIAGVNNRGLPLDHGSEGAGVFLSCPVADRAAIPGAGVESDESLTYNFTTPNASAAIFAGGLAVLLEANPNLTIPDLLFIPAMTADQVQPDSLLWNNNSFGLKFNRRVGFGRLNLGKAVEYAEHWTSLGNFSSKSSVYEVDLGKETKTMGDSKNFTLNFNTGNDDDTVLFIQIDLQGAQLSFASLNPHILSPDGSDFELKILSESDREMKVKNIQLPAYAFLGDRVNGNWTLVFNKIDDAFLGLVTKINITIFYAHNRPDTNLINQTRKANPFKPLPYTNVLIFPDNPPPMIAAQSWDVSIKFNETYKNSNYTLMFLQNENGTERTKVKAEFSKDYKQIHLNYVPSVFNLTELYFVVESLDPLYPYTATTKVSYINNFKEDGIYLLEAHPDNDCTPKGNISDTPIKSAEILFENPCIVAYYVLHLNRVTDDGYSSSITQSIITSENQVILNRTFIRNLGMVQWKSIVPSNRAFKFQLSPSSSGRHEMFSPITVEISVKEQYGPYKPAISPFKLWNLIFMICLFVFSFILLFKIFWTKGIKLEGYTNADEVALI